MKFFRIDAVFILSCFLTLCIETGTASELDRCTAMFEEERQKAVTALHDLELAFRDAGWYYRKSQEMIHGPLWEAYQLKLSFSKNQKAEAQVLFDRYRKLADADYEDALRESQIFSAKLKILERSLHLNAECSGNKLLSQTPVPQKPDPISAFNNCIDEWQESLRLMLHDLSRTLKKYVKTERHFTLRLEDSLRETLSDHPAFHERYQTSVSEAIAKYTEHFLLQVRRLKDHYELKWPGSRCCQVCLSDKAIQEDPVLSTLKPDYQASRGVGGTVTNKSSLKDAFEQFDEAEKAQKAEEA